jgi:lipopolysaccharide transport system ATP-binding protein
MSSEPQAVELPAIRVDRISKCYPVYDRPFDRLRQFVAPRVAQLFGRQSKAHYREYWALREISCEIRRGEQIGIVGRNGAGKSTLLQILCGTLAPTTGSVTVNGRIAALLELGAGFNPEFTGRENVLLNASILGLTAQEIDQRMDPILAFADIGGFIEQPVKTYSSGMYMRLAFAVAIHVTPDILVVDEALSVGDEAFQRKCFARIRAIRETGGTVLFVSHSAGTVAEVCDRAILLDRGELLAIGNTRDVLARYQKLLYAPAEKALEVREWIVGNPPGDATAHLATTGVAPNAFPASVDDIAGDDENDPAWFDQGLLATSAVAYPHRGASIGTPQVETLHGRMVNVLAPGHEYIYRYPAHFDGDAVGVRFGMMVKTVTGVELGGAATAPDGEGLPLVKAGADATARFRFRCLLAPGTYFFNAGIVGLIGEHEQYLAREVDALMIRVLPDPQRIATGLVNLDVRPGVELHV